MASSFCLARGAADAPARSGRVQAPGNTALFGLLQDDIEHAAMVET
jgi:hypothetical protein